MTATFFTPFYHASIVTFDILADLESVKRSLARNEGRNLRWPDEQINYAGCTVAVTSICRLVTRVDLIVLKR